MTAGSKAIVVGTLFLFGYGGGFFLSAQASKHVELLAPAHRQKAGGGSGGGSGQVSTGREGSGGGGSGGGGGGGGAGGGSGGGGAGGGGSGGGAGGAGGGEGGSAAGGGAGGGSGGTEGPGRADGSGGAANSSAGADGASPLAPPCPSVELTGPEAAAFLSGNTVADAVEEGGAHPALFFAPRGWWGTFGAASIVVRPWNPKLSVLCSSEGHGDGKIACDVIRVRKCSSEAAKDLTIGYLLLRNDHWSRIVRGNVRDFPAYIPVLDKADGPRRPPGDGQSLRPQRRAAHPNLFDRSRAYLKRVPGPDEGEHLYYFAENGVRIDFAMPSDDYRQDGVPINLGWWTLNKGVLCQGSGSDTKHPSCSKPKPRPDGHVVLVSTAKDPQVELVAMRDAPRSQADDD